MTDRNPLEVNGLPTGWRQRLRTIEAAAVAGIVAAVAWVYGLVRLLDGPQANASEAEFAAYFAKPDTGWDTLAVLQVIVFGTAGFLWFVGVIRSRLGAAEPKLFDTVFFGGGMLFSALIFVGSAALAAPFILADLGRVGVEPGTAAMARSFAIVVLAVFAPRVAALIVFSSSTLGLRTGALPRWLVAVGYLTGFVLLVDVTFSSPSVYIFPGWMALVSLVLLFRH
jgi:hypothetical protein